MTPLHATATDFSCTMFSTTPGTSSIVMLASRCFAPFADGMVDRIDRRASLVLLGARGPVFALLLKRAEARSGAPLEHPQRWAA